MKKNRFCKVLSIITFILSIILLVLANTLNIVPIKYFIPSVVFILGVNFVNLFFSFKIKLKKKGNILFIILSLILSSIMLVGSFYIFKTILFVDENFKFKGYTTENYSIVVLNDSSYQKLSELKEKKLGALKEDKNEKKMINYLKDEIDFSLEEYHGILDIKDALYSGKIDAMVIEDSYKSILDEEDNEFKNKVRVIYTFSLKYKVENIVKDVDVTKDIFTIYIAGIDTYGNVSSVSRSDVNMLVTINPKINQVLLTAIPRDYYVQLHGTTGYKDKLTHAGIYGVDMSVQTIEDILDIDIKYYIRVNFTSLIKLVDALGGIDVYSEYNFNSNAGYETSSGYNFTKGYNHVNGEQALAFVRTRQAFIGGDRVRGKNQQAVIEAIIRKAASSAIITKYTSILDSLEGSFETNLSMNDITSLARYQIDKMPSWNISSISLDGSNGSEYTYSYSGQKLYVMIPNEESINNAKNKLDAIYNNEKLESSYGEVGNIKNPGNVQPVIPSQPETPKVPEQSDEDSETDIDSDNNENSSDSNLGDNEESNNDSDQTLEDHIQDILGGTEENNTSVNNGENNDTSSTTDESNSDEQSNEE